MSRRATVLLAIVLSLLVAAPVDAITNGQLDGEMHPNVGALIANVPPYGDIVLCSGTLVAPTLFLTAAHCVEDTPDLVIVGVSFDPAPVDPQTGEIVGEVVPVAGDGVHPHPDYAARQDDPHDIAIIELAENDVTPHLPWAGLPLLHAFDALARTDVRSQQFTAVGYGSTGRLHEQGEGAPAFIYPDTRMSAVSTFLALNSAWLRLSMNTAHDDGGTCYGDSGGPNFLGAETSEQSIIAGITITGDTACRATNVIYRLDSLSAQTFLATFGLVPPPNAKPGPGTTDHGNKAKAAKSRGKGKGKHRQGAHRR